MDAVIVPGDAPIPGNPNDPDRGVAGTGGEYPCSGDACRGREGTIKAYWFTPTSESRDSNGDGYTDLLFRDTAGTVPNRHHLWTMNGLASVPTRIAEDHFTPDPSSSWVGAAADDFNGDGKLDLVFHNTSTDAIEFWLMNGVARVGSPASLASPLTSPWMLAATGDFNADGKSDLLWRNNSTQKLLIWTMNGTVKTGEITPHPDQAANANWSVVAALDYGSVGGFDVERNRDLLWYNSTSGKIVLWFMDSSVSRTDGVFTIPDSAGNNNWQVQAGGDFGVGSGGVTGSNDIMWRNATSGKLVAWYMDFAGNRTAGVFTSPDGPDFPAGDGGRPATDWLVFGPK